MTAREAATLLGIHYNTVRNRIKAGTIQAEKVITEHGETWMIDPDTLTDNAPTSADQQLVGRVPEEALTMLAREIVREAGLAQNAQLAAQLEKDKANGELLRAVLLLDIALVTAMGAFAAFMPDLSQVRWLGVALSLVGISTPTALVGLVANTRFLGAQGRALRGVVDWFVLLAGVTFMVGLLVFQVFVALSLTRGFLG